MYSSYSSTEGNPHRNPPSSLQENMGSLLNQETLVLVSLWSTYIKWIDVGPLHHVNIILLLLTVIWIVKLCLYLVGWLWTATITHIYQGRDWIYTPEWLYKLRILKRFLIKLLKWRGQDFSIASVLSKEILWVLMQICRRLEGSQAETWRGGKSYCMTLEGGDSVQWRNTILPSENCWVCPLWWPLMVHRNTWIRRKKKKSC